MATGIIQNDDALPTISVDDVSVSESNIATFTVSLSNASYQTIGVDYTTTNVTAIAGVDYNAASNSLTFLAGETSKTVDVTTLVDTGYESDEYYTLDLSNLSNAAAGDMSGTGTITNCVDADMDGYCDQIGSRDCDGTNATVYSGAPEICDGLDNDCNGTPDDGDEDGDGYLDCNPYEGTGDLDNDGTPNRLDQDDDGDSVSSLAEANTLDGDFNDDGIPDAYQPLVTAISEFGIVASGPGCTRNSNLTYIASGSLPQSSGITYDIPHGMYDYTVDGCSQVTVELHAFNMTNTVGLEPIKLMNPGGESSYYYVASGATFATEGEDVTISYTITDGAWNDINGPGGGIRDPLG